MRLTAYERVEPSRLVQAEARASYTAILLGCIGLR